MKIMKIWILRWGGSSIGFSTFEKAKAYLDRSCECAEWTVKPSEYSHSHEYYEYDIYNGKRVIDSVEIEQYLLDSGEEID